MARFSMYVSGVMASHADYPVIVIASSMKDYDQAAICFDGEIHLIHAYSFLNERVLQASYLRILSAARYPRVS